MKSLGYLNASKFNPNGSAYPDISALALNVGIFTSGQAEAVCGTSASAPIVAAHIVLLNNRRQQRVKGIVGCFNPLLHAHPEAMNGITMGKTGGCNDDDTLYFPATKRWDAGSSLGMPKFKTWQQVFA